MTRDPFKFLDAYSLEDADLFYGREREIEDLYSNVFQSRLLLLYGASGTGKTSLVQCGLANSFHERDWLPIHVRYDKGLLLALDAAIEKRAKTRPKPGASLSQRLASLYLDHFKPVQLIFDQFEELFTRGDEAEREAFALAIAEVLAPDSEASEVRVLLIVREEYLAACTPMEWILPELFANRQRLERMGRTAAERAIVEPCRVCGVEVKEELASEILDRLGARGPGLGGPSGTAGIELTYLQVVLDKLYKRALAASPDRPELKHEDLDALGSLDNILGDFLTEQLGAMPDAMAPTAEAILKSMVTTEGTKKPMRLEELLEELPGLECEAERAAVLDALGRLVAVRILREKDDAGGYELRHDALAGKIFERMSAMEKDLLEIVARLESRLREYEKDGDLLDATMLRRAAPFAPRLGFKPKLAKLIEDSQREAKKRLRRRRMVLGGLVALAFVVLAGFTAWNVRERNEAKRQEGIAKANETKAMEQEARAMEQEQKANANAEEARAREQDAKRSLAEIAKIYATEGNKARDHHDFGSALLRYRASLDLLENQAARIGAAETMPKTRPEYAVLRGHNESINAVAFSPKEPIIASSSEKEDIVHLWDSANGKELPPLPAQGKVYSLAFSPDGHMLVAGAGYNRIRIWDIASREELPVLEWKDNSGKVDRGHAHSLVFSRDGRQLASGSCGDNVIRLWNLSSRKEMMALQGHGETVRTLAFSPDGKLLASGSEDKTILLWDLVSGKKRYEFKAHEGSVWTVAFSPDGNILASGANDNTIRLWDPASEKELAVLKGHMNTVRTIAFSPDGRTLLSGADDKTIRLWNPASGKEIAVLNGHEDGVSGIALSSDSRFLASGAKDKTIRFWDMADSKELLGIQGDTFTLAFRPDRPELASGGWDGVIRFWDIASRKELAVIDKYKGPATSLAFSPDGKILASGSILDTTIHLWDPGSHEELAELIGHNGSINSLAFSQDGRVLASGAKAEIRLWDVPNRMLLHILPGHKEEVWYVAFSPDGRRLASSTEIETILWDSGNGTKLETFKGAPAAFSPNGRFLALVDGQYIRLLNPKSHKELGVLRGHGNGIQRITFSPDSRYLASASADKTIRLWDPTSGKELRMFSIFDYNITFTIAFSPDSRILAATCMPRDLTAKEKKILLWDLGSGDPKTFLARLSAYTDLGFSYNLDVNGQPTPKDPVALAQARLDAAREGRIPWREDGGKSLVPLYENELAQAQAATGAQKGAPPTPDPEQRAQ